MSTPLSSPAPTLASSESSSPTNLFTLLLSFQWVRLLVLGSALETLRQFALGCYEKFISSFFITASFEEDDSAYDWMMFWLSKQPSWRTTRNVEISTRHFGLNVEDEDETSARDSDSLAKLSYLPSLTTSYSFWYHRRRMSVYRSKENTGYWGKKEETLVISIMTRDHRILNSLLLEARKAYRDAQETNISIYVSDSNNGWRHLASRPKRPLRSILLDPGVKEELLEDALDFLESKEWYTDRGIPFRRGYLLYGAPGTGKTSFIHGLAGELGLDVYIISLSRAGLDDTALNSLISDLPEKCIAIMEDIDAAFTRGINREAPSTSSNPSPPSEDDKSKLNSNNNNTNQPAPSPPPPPSASRVTLSGLLNALDGVGAQEGRILYATTNKYDALDPALCRPGRMDKHVEFKLASRFQAGEMFRRFYESAESRRAGTAEDEKKREEEEEKVCGKDSDSVDSGFGEDVPLVDGVSGSPPPSPTARKSRTRPPRLAPSELSALASQFEEAIPDRELSMASLQGYLMRYKIRPWNAVREVGEWVESEREKRQRKKS